MKETLRAVIVWLLTVEARLVIRKYKPNIIVVTGSVGKTSAKDALFTALKSSHFIRKSEKTFNSDIGVPLTILGVPNGWSNLARWMHNLVDGLLLYVLNAPYPEWLIVEVGADRPGDIVSSLSWLKPRVVVATRFPEVPVHVEFYDSPEAVQREELAPLSWLRTGGTAVLNADDEKAVAEVLPAGTHTTTYGISSSADVRALRIKTLSTKGVPRGVSFDVLHGEEKAHVVLNGVVGLTHVYAALAGIAGARALAVPLSVACSAFSTYEPPAGRMRLISGLKDTMLIDDSYNASPVAMEEALSTLGLTPRTARRIAVLGDMLELGAYSVVEHEKVGARAATTSDLLVTVGMRARKIAEAAQRAGMPTDAVLQFDRASDAGAHLLGIIAEGDVVLVKGSQGMRMERTVKLLMANPEEAKTVLCRQDKEWLTR